MRRSLLVATLIPAAALAHHGWSTYDPDKPVSVTSKLSEVSWSNPHATAKVAYQRRTWDVVLAPVARMETRGLTPAMLKSGKPVTLEGQVRKDGTPEMKIDRLTLDGRTYELR
ncbi:DUF6152 family protein [Sphingomonas sp. BIUV-7]|uniref:DUF6152 family protein n=2 Tax=Sphingomonas natans TaxID=3063330 RepID=A0ABT8Y7F1_9SPHN|nr:DUF6152 family protein [Sphingomonas sp. BIUV-7]